ncbi:VCBS domain-containing protein [Pseudoruegeria sp. SHC-113]|uniref:VCBS domain-containing protein n=1 Tax=Pseudoruegeria sp. SHC-113 TaxID=2855439 RepID=UPI0021BAC731|nr:VCBS domain-containing protein [Pseudoruegeria sp. SHC-113]MCT8160493.1 VCBS domain-containing protein [Pseudoruegeria sp. SHC-113]
MLIYDDGRIKTTAYTDGVVTEVSQTDPFDTMSWSSRTTTYDLATGQKSHIAITYDDGRSQTETFVGGFRATRNVTDANDAYTWTSKVSSYDAFGALTQMVTNHDDGRITTSNHNSGVLTSRTIVDVDDAFDWAQRDFTYDPSSGLLLSRRTEYDTGVVEVETSFLGPLNGTVARTDTLDLYGWDSITETYDVSGALTQVVRVNDDGVRQTTDYIAGQRATASWTDVNDTKNWDSRSATYDAAGRLASLRITYDEGHVSQRIYTNGVLTRRLDADVNDAYDWNERDFAYDANERIIGSGTLADDGTVTIKFYTDGILTSITQEDVSDNHGWTTIQTKFDSAGAFLHTTRIEDDGSFTTRDARGRDVFEGTKSDTVVEDSAITLRAAGAVTFVDGYRGSQLFNGFQNVTGLAGLGSFTVNNDGTWTYTAINNQFGIQTLNAGETITDSVQVTTHDGATVLLTVEFQGENDSAAPVYLGNSVEIIGSVGLLAAPLSFDLGSLFSDDQGEDLAITISGVPAGFQFNDGVLTSPSGGTNQAGIFTRTVTATDSDGNSTSQLVQLHVGLQQNFDVVGLPPLGGLVLDLSDAADLLFFGAYQDFGTENHYLNLWGGDDTVHFGDQPITTFAQIFIDGGQGNDSVAFGDYAGTNSGQFSIAGGTGEDLISFGDHAARNAGSISVGGGADDDTMQFGLHAGSSGSVSLSGSLGDDTYTFGGLAATGGIIRIQDQFGHNTTSFGASAATTGGEITYEGALNTDSASIQFGLNAAAEGGSIDLTTGAGDDVIGFADFAANDAAAFSISTGAGEDSLSFGDNSAKWGTQPGLVGTAVVTIDTGADDDTVYFGTSVSQATSRTLGQTTGIDLTLGSGSDTAIFGADAGSALAQILIQGDAGDDTITFGARAGTVSIQGGTGAEMITFAEGANDITVDFGADTDADRLTMGFFTSLTLTNFDHTRDALSIARVGDWVWNMVDDGVGTTTLQATGGPLITFTDTTGVAASDLLAGVNLNRATAFIGVQADKDLGVIGVGNATSGFSTDIRSLFADPDITDGFIDTMRVNSGPLPSFMAFDGTTFALSNLTDVANVGLYSVNFTGQDIFGAGVTETFTFELGLHNDYGNYAPVFYLDDIITGSDFSDVMTVGTVAYGATDEGGGFYLNGGARHDVLTIGAVTMESDFSVFSVDGGTGNDAITIAGFAASGASTSQSVAGGTGADTVTFDGDVQGLTIDLGADTDADTLTFKGRVTDVTNRNWVAGDDAITFAGVDPTALWTAEANPDGDLVFTSTDGQSFTVLGAGAETPADMVSGITLNTAPTYVGPDPADFSGEVGLLHHDHFAVGLNSLFSDAELGLGDKLSFSVESRTLPVHFDTRNGGLYQDAYDFWYAGTHFIKVTATDHSGAQVTQYLKVNLAMDHIFSSSFEFNYVTASILADTLKFRDDQFTRAGNAEVHTYGGDDIITIGKNVASGAESTLDIFAGDGADAITLGDGVGRVTVHFGSDTDADTLTLLGGAKALIVANWTQGLDTIALSSTARWRAVDVNADKVFTSTEGDQITVLGTAGLDAAAIIAGLNFNADPTYIGPTPAAGDPIPAIFTGMGGSNVASGFTLDLKTLFSDADIAQGDSLTYQITAPTLTFTLVNGVLTHTGFARELEARDHTLTLTATDTLGASVSQTVTVAIAMDHVFGTAETNTRTTPIDASSLDDTLVFDDYSAFDANMWISTHEGDDTLTFLDYAASSATLGILMGDGNDTATFGTEFGSGSLINFFAGNGDDQITLGLRAGGAPSGLHNFSVGAGADVINIGHDAGNVSVYLGLDLDADQLVIDGSRPASSGVDLNIIVNEWTLSDSITVTGSSLRWNAEDINSNKVYTDAFGRKITIIGAAGQDDTIVSGLTLNRGPSYTGNSPITNASNQHVYALGAAGSRVVDASFSLNLENLFTDPEGEHMSYAVTGLPAHLKLASGSLIVYDPMANLNLPSFAGDYVVTLTATDDLGASVSHQVVFATAMDHDFGEAYQSTAYDGSSLADTYTYGNSAHEGRVAHFATLGGNDLLTFGNDAFKDADLRLDLGDGDDQVTFGDHTGAQSTTTLKQIYIDGGEGADTFGFGDHAGLNAVMTVLDGGGTTSMTFGDYAGQDGTMDLFSAWDNDTFLLGDHAGHGGTLRLFSDSGADTITLGSHAGEDAGAVTITAHYGDDVVTVGAFAGLNGGQVNINLGTGADRATVGADAETVIIDLGNDADADTLMFLGSVTTGTVRHYDQGTDTVDVVSHTAWRIVSDDGVNTVLSDGTSTLTFEGVTGLSGGEDFLI